MSLEERELLQRVRGRFEVPTELKPNNILVIGDVHGFTDTYQKFIKRLPEGQRTVQIGDMALGFAGIVLHPMSDNHKFFRGNHDCPEECRAHPNYLGDYGYDAANEIFHLAGAWSIDRAMRTEGETWWRDEELSYEELDKAVELYRQAKPRFVLSHDCPSKTNNVLLYNLLGSYFLEKNECGKSRTAQAMQIMLDYHAPEQWAFGHYHFDKQFYVLGFDTKFICVGGMMQSGEPPHTYWLDLI
jgi:Calcineurin-like phosphoesterase